MASVLGWPRPCDDVTLKLMWELNHTKSTKHKFNKENAQLNHTWPICLIFFSLFVAMTTWFIELKQNDVQFTNPSVCLLKFIEETKSNLLLQFTLQAQSKWINEWMIYISLWWSLEVCRVKIQLKACCCNFTFSHLNINLNALKSNQNGAINFYFFPFASLTRRLHSLEEGKKFSFQQKTLFARFCLATFVQMSIRLI